MTSQDEEIPPREGANPTCNAERVRLLVGRQATTELGGNAVRESGARAMRWIQPDSAYTMDFRPDRLNIHLDAQGRITRVNCG